VHVADEQIAVAIHRLVRAVGSRRRGELAPAFRRAAATATPAAAGRLAAERALRDLGGLLGRHVEAVPLAVELVFEGLGVVGPGRRDGARLHRAGDLRRDLLIVVIARHRLEPVLRAQGGSERDGGKQAKENGAHDARDWGVERPRTPWDEWPALCK